MTYTPPEPKEEKNNPRAIAAVLLLMGVFFIILGLKNLAQIASTFYVDQHTAQATIKDGYRNKWPRFKTFTQQLEFKAADGTLISAEAISATPLAPGSTVKVIYAPRNTQQVYLDNAFLTAASYDFGVLALGLFIALYGVSKLSQMVKGKLQGAVKVADTQVADTLNPTPLAEAATATLSAPVTSKTLTALRVLQNTLILGFFICIISYLMGGAS